MQERHWNRETNKRNTPMEKLKLVHKINHNQTYNMCPKQRNDQKRPIRTKNEIPKLTSSSFCASAALIWTGCGAGATWPTACAGGLITCGACGTCGTCAACGTCRAYQRLWKLYSRRCVFPFRERSMPFSRHFFLTVNEFFSTKLKKKENLQVTTYYRTPNLCF